MSATNSRDITRNPTLESVQPTLHDSNDSKGNEAPPAVMESPGGAQFWLVIMSLMVATFVSAIDVTAVATALPTIVAKLHGEEFVWVGSAYNLASTAILPLSGGMAQIFGRKPVLLGALIFFLIGSGICGGATSMGMLIAGRTVQGIGSGGILSLTEIVIADLVPLAQRGTYFGLIGFVWAIACASGPPLGGALSGTQWRWLFYLNIPLTAIATVLVIIFLQVKTPREDFRTKMGRMDWIGNGLVIASTTSTIIALSWGGVKYSWTSPRVLVPLILGLLGLAAFFLYEGKYPKEPVIPWTLFRNKTSVSGYMGTFWHGIVFAAASFYLPVYFQAVKLQSAIGSGVSILGLSALIPPGAILGGVTVTIFKRYLPQNVLGWILVLLGSGLLTLLHADASRATTIGVQMPGAFGMGLLFTATTYPILAPLPLEETAHALALFAFIRNFAFTWGTTIGSTILQNQLTQRLPTEYLSTQPTASKEIAYQVIPTLKALPEPLRTAVRVAFAESLRTVWFTLIGFSVVGLLSTVIMREIVLREVTDEQWGMQAENKVKQLDVEKLSSGMTTPVPKQEA